MEDPDALDNFDDAAVRDELLKMLEREETRLSAEASVSLAKGAKEAEELGPDAQAQWQAIEDRIRQRGTAVFNRIREYVERSR